MDSDAYRVLARTAQAEIKVKGSRFIAHLHPVADKNEAEQIYRQIKKKYHDATHNCFAYRINEHIFRYSDDGEPSGTAGKPMLNILDGAELLEVLAIVTRYFGGTKLGTGGLIRAYSDAVNAALAAARFTTKTYYTQLVLTMSYDLEPFSRSLIDRYAGRVIEARYEAEVEMLTALPASRSEPFITNLIDKSHSAVQIRKLSPTEEIHE